MASDESESDSSDSEDIPNANPWLPVYENQPERLLYRFTPATLSGTLPAPDAHPSEYFYLFMTPSLLQSIFLHLNNNQNDTKVDALFKVSPVLESLNKSFLKYYIPDRNLSIDESLVKQKNRTQKRHNIPKSHAKFGIKHWVLCKAQSGYTLQFDIYAGKADSKPSSPKAVSGNRCAVAHWCAAKNSRCAANIFVGI
ncbi:hypothetical protein LAZ67_10002318 [Cordylochernes scorpioides]|uniref:PiggyBac transposable element-derived protein domain-containing protein n=1 Tax=Cordylochernes scorpioides TaxID=51811 RepID=A0ABY6KX30_9ARAC|nr:hypothetical protein LAZ67_10002318 [Cordylochernes scorpioides]